jgi:outer membrane protein assembly factor BamB
LNPQTPGGVEHLLRHFVCVDVESGGILWLQDVKPPCHKTRIPESAAWLRFTHAGLGGKNIQVLCAQSALHDFDLNGSKVWPADVGEESEPGKRAFSSSQIVYDNTVISKPPAKSQLTTGLYRITGQPTWRQQAEASDGVWGTPSPGRLTTIARTFSCVL